MLCDVVVVIVGRMLAIFTMRKELHGFLFQSMHACDPVPIVMGLRLAALWAAGPPL